LWGSPNFRADENTSRYDRDVLNNLDDDLLREAERNVQDRWRREGRKFHWRDNNCQNYILEALKEYNKLKKEKEKEEIKKGSES